MKEIIGVGFTIPSANEGYLRIDSFSSLSDADIVIFSPNLSLSYYSTIEGLSWSSESGSYEGKPLYNKDSSAKILEHSKHWVNEITNFVKSGRTVFIPLTKREDFFIHTGTKDISGTGRNQKVTNHVIKFSNYNFLPFKKINFKNSSGKTIVSNNPIFKDFHSNFKDFMSFDVYLEGDEISNPTFTSKNKYRTLGVNLKLGDGHIIMMPNINFDNSEFTTYNEEKDESYWTDDAVKTGKKFINAVVEIDRALKKGDTKTPKPEWLNGSEFQLVGAEKTRKLITKNLMEIEKRTKENENLNSVLEEQESLKDLLFESGKPLEQAVIKALKLLGYSAENYDDGELELDQVIYSPEGIRYIGECEGKDSKDIDVSKFRQLQDSLNADFERDEVEEKAYGILFGNPQRLKNPKERNLDFTKKCQSGASREKIALIKTSDLYTLARYLVENEDSDFQKLCREAIFSQLGSVVVFPEIKK